MSTVESSTINDVIESLQTTIDNFPSEIRHFLHELKYKDEKIAHLQEDLDDRRRDLLRVSKKKNAPVPEASLSGQSSFQTAMTSQQSSLLDEKLALIQKSINITNKHLSRLSSDLVKVEEEARAEGVVVDVEFDQLVANLRHNANDGTQKRQKQPQHHPGRGRGRKPSHEQSQHKQGASNETLFAAPVEEMTLQVADQLAPPDEKRYCICHRVSYGEMVGCDNENCPYEWFHLECVGLTAVPDESVPYFCAQCASKNKKSRKH